jgi:RND family efflux transporter MFP subunit
VKNLRRRYQIAGGVIIIALIAVAAHFASGSPAEVATPDTTPHVKVASAASLSSAAGPLTLTGKVTSLNQATILAQTGGELVSLNVKIGDKVAAGQVLGQFENSTQQAAVTAAEGAYEAALASRSSASPQDAATAARNTYASAYATVDATVHNDIDTVYGSPTPYGPNLIINSGNATDLSRRKSDVDAMLDTWQSDLANAGSTDPQTLLTEAYADTETIATLANDLATAAHDRDSRATSDQLSALSSAQATLAALLSTLSTAEATYQAKSVTTTAGADASVKQAQGALEGAKAALEKTIVRSPVGGTVVSLPVNQGDFVAAMSQVAQVSNPGALKIDIQVTPDDAKTLEVGGKAVVDGGIPGVIADIAPAVDPSTSKIPLTVDLEGAGQLVDGDTVTVSLDRTTAAPTVVASGTSAITIPIIATKITPAGPIVFTVASSTLAAHPVTLGTILGDRVTIVSGLTGDDAIVTDARGLSDGETVVVDAP